MKLVQRTHGFTMLTGQAEARSWMGAVSGWNQVPRLEWSWTHGIIPSLQALLSLPPTLFFSGVALGHRAASPRQAMQGHYMAF